MCFAELLKVLTAVYFQRKVLKVGQFLNLDSCAVADVKKMNSVVI